MKVCEPVKASAERWPTVQTRGEWNGLEIKRELHPRTVDDRQMNGHSTEIVLSLICASSNENDHLSAVVKMTSGAFQTATPTHGP